LQFIIDLDFVESHPHDLGLASLGLQGIFTISGMILDPSMSQLSCKKNKKINKKFKKKK